VPPEPLPPQDLVAEEWVLGAMMLSRQIIDPVAEILTAGDFYRASHGRIFDACLALHRADEAVDVLTVHDRLLVAGDIADVGGVERLREIATIVPVAGSAPFHARIVREHAIARELLTYAKQVETIGRDRQVAGQPAQGHELVSEAERLLLELAQVRRHHGADDFATADEAASGMLERLTELHKHGSEIVGISTSYADIDKLTLGLEPGQLVVVAARPSIGKTAFVLGTVWRAILADQPIPSAFVTLEMSKYEVMQRLASMESGIDLAQLRNGQIGTEQWHQVVKALGRIAPAPLFIEDTGILSLVELRSKARRLKLRRPDLGLIVVDYIQLMTSGVTKYESRTVEVSQVSRGLKQLAGELQVPIVALSQLSREVEKRHDKRPMLSDLRESGGIEADADVVILLYRDEYYFPEEVDNAGIAEVNVAKQRNGPTGMRKLSFVKRNARFADMAQP
jgi:replicative DNA helicase